MHFLHYILCTASLVAAAPSKHSSPGVSIQVNFEEKYRSSAVQPLASLPGRFELEAISDELDGAPFGAEYLDPYALLSTAQRTTFFLVDSKLVANAPDFSGGYLSVGPSPLRIFPPLVALQHPSAMDLAFDWEAVEKSDGMYLEMTEDCKCLQLSQSRVSARRLD